MTDTRSFSGVENQRFWSANTASYQAEKNAPEIIYLARECLGRRILDAGAGEGSLLRALRRALPDSEVIGVDIAPKSSDVEEGDLAALRFSDDDFDTVFCCEVIEHVTPEDTARILAELRRVLRPGGHLVLTTPYDENLDESVVTCPSCERSFHRWGHQQRFVEEDFERITKAAGLEVVDISPVKYSRVRRLRFLGPRFFRSQWMKKRLRRAGGHRKLFLIARKRAN